MLKYILPKQVVVITDKDNMTPSPFKIIKDN